MINTSGLFSVIDHGITINWEDGPTLHKMTAQMRYRTAADGPLLTLRVGASQRCQEWADDSADCFAAANGDLSARWLWRALGAGWIATLHINNISQEALMIEGLDIIRIETHTGLFNLGAPAGRWQIQTTPERLLVQPIQSDRSRPPAVLFRAVSMAPIEPNMTSTDEPSENVNEMHELDEDEIRTPDETLLTKLAEPVEMELQINDGRFAQFTASLNLAGMPLPPNAALSTPGVWVMAGDDLNELNEQSAP